MAEFFTSQSFGKTKDGEEVTLFRISNTSKAYVEILNYGCIIKSIYVPDENNELKNIALGFDTLAQYEASPCPPGAVLGRCAGKAPHAGFVHKVWDVAETGENYVVLFRRSPDGEDGCPGNLDLFVRYMWVDYNRLVIDFAAISDKETPVNLTSYVLFNLDDESTLAENTLRLFANKVAEKGPDGKYTGVLLPVEGAPAEGETPEFITLGAGSYDEFYVAEGDQIRPLAELNSPKSGNSLSVYTTMPGVHFMTVDKPAAGAVLAQQFLAAAADMSSLPSVVLAPGQEWKHRIIYGIDKIYDNRKK